MVATALPDCPSEELLQAYLSRELQGEDLGNVETHVAECSRCTAVIANVLPPDAGVDEALLPAGTIVDRYQILATAGQGAIGVVHAAYDPKLDRKVALKVLRRPGPDLEQRLLREARAMARLQDAHVVAVHDVGTFDGGLFVAMDFVEGKTLRAWLAERRRPWREIIDAFVQAGRGLAAAHDAGIVHRDFKPDNVLVRQDGTIAVTDFGLARASGGTGIAAAPRDAPLELTATGALLGTPAYMSPEQLAGRTIDARSDLFSFCVTLYAALFGEHPFPLSSPRALLAAIEGGRVRPPGDAPVPRSIREAVLAGLRPRPEDRPRDMRALLDALQRRPRRTALLALAGAAALGVVAAAATMVPRERAPVCRGAERKLTGVWDTERRRAVRQALEATGHPLAGETARGVERLFDAYAGTWVAAHTDACEDTQVRGEQSEALLDKRMACLEERRQRWAALERTLEKAGASDIARALPAAHDLPRIEACADPRQLVESDPSLSPVQRPLVTLARVSIDRARALEALGRYKDGLDQLAPALALARATGHAPLEAEAQLVAGMLHFETDPGAAEKALVAAAVAAERAGRLDITTEAEVRLVKNLGWHLGRTDEALRFAEFAEAHLQRLGDPLLAAELLHARGVAYQQSKEPARALPVQLEAVAAFESVLGPTHPRVGQAVNAVGISLAQAGRYDEALPAFRRALAISEASLGTEHPETLKTRTNLATLWRVLGHLSEALVLLQAALDGTERVLGPDSILTRNAVSNLANTYTSLEQFDAAVPLARRALAMDEKLGVSEGQRVLALGHLAEALAGSGAADEADRLSRQALEIGERLGEGHDLLRRAVLDRASVLVLSRHCREAMPLLQKGVALFEKSAPEDPEVAFPLDGIGACELAAGRRAPARAAYARALAVREAKLSPDHYLIALSLLGLAEVALSDGDAPAARAQAARAVAILEKAKHPIALARARATLARAAR